MKNLFTNIVKGLITSIIGTVLMIMVIILLWTGRINLIWEGTVGIILGCLLLMAPKTIEQKISQFIKAWGGRSDLSSSTDTTTTLID